MTGEVVAVLHRPMIVLPGVEVDPSPVIEIQEVEDAADPEAGLIVATVAPDLLLRDDDAPEAEVTVVRAVEVLPEAVG